MGLMLPGPNRITPALPVAAFRTFAVRSPADVEVVSACETAGCAAWRNGWETLVDERTALGAAQAAYIRRRSGRTFAEARSGPLTVFRFGSRQRCFREHRTRPETYGVRDGDWRGNPTGRRRVHANADDWIEDYAEQHQRLLDARERG